MTRRPDAGFTLLEAVIAFAIAALALGVLFQGAGAALRTTHEAERLAGAVERARSHLAEAAVLLGSAGERVEEGDDTSYHWRVRISPAQAASARRAGGTDPDLANPIRLYRIEVEESWSERGHVRTFRLRSELLSVAPPAPA